MNLRYHKVVFVYLSLIFQYVNSAVVQDDGEVDQQGLYSKSDHVEILTNRNFERKAYGQKYGLIIQFYNSYCGHCRAFAPKYKNLAGDIVNWKNIIKLAVIDCAVEENNEICRQFEVMAYPSLRYLHENYVKGNTNVGDKISVTDTAEKLKLQIIAKIQNEQSTGHLRFAPSLDIGSYASYSAAMQGISSEIDYTILVLENANSTVGSELALDLNDYPHVKVKRVFDTSELASLANLKQFPGVIIVNKALQPTLLTPKDYTKQNILLAINNYLKSKNYNFPSQNIDIYRTVNYDPSDEETNVINTDLVYYSDLEKTLKTSLHTEITRFKLLNGEPLQALLDYLDVILVSFPFRGGNLKKYISDLKATFSTKNSWSGSEVYDLVKRLEQVHAPVYTSNLEYYRCKGSEPKFRGYTCGLWSLFHSLTVNAAQKPGLEGPRVLKAMHGYIKHFFGCTDCTEHFQAMAARNRIFDVKENDKAVLWLWISHNEVNLRLAGDITEDPEHPKIQFPSITRCPECRLARGAWNLPAVYQYLINIYGAENIQVLRRTRSPTSAASPFSNLDIGMLSLLYILSFIMLILVLKFFFSRRHKKRFYKQGLGKV